MVRAGIPKRHSLHQCQRLSIASLGLLFCALLTACGASEAVAFVDFGATAISATPSPLLLTDTITINATIQNTGDSPSGSFVVRAWLKPMTNCNGVAYPVGEQTFSLAAGASASFQVSAVVSNVPAIGTYYLCILIDADGQVVESDETNNAVGTSIQVMVVGCFADPDCDDGNPCTSETCDPLLGCQAAPAPGPCEDGFFCTIGDRCEGGFCQRGTPRLCADPDLCDGTMFCNELTGACANGQPPLPCDDGDACNGLETCNPVDGLCLAGTPISCDVLVNNGLGPPTSTNFINHASFDEASGQRVLLRSQSCPPSGLPDASCPAPGLPTTLEVATGGNAGDVEIFDTSLLEVTGGLVTRFLSAAGTWVDLSGGVVESGESSGTTLIGGGNHGYLKLLGQATISGGTIDDLELDSDLISPGGVVRGGKVMTLFSATASEVRGGRVSILCAMGDPGTIYGSNFNLNSGMYGPIAGTTGFITGTLESGDPMNATYHQTGSTCYHPVNGTIATSGAFTLLPPASTFIANGLSFSDPLNVIDAIDTATQFHDVVIRNVNCPNLWPSAFTNGPCTSPGVPSSVEVVGGAVIPGSFSVLDSSVAVIRGGQVAALDMSAGARIEVLGEGFTVGSSPVPFGEVVATSGILAGTLASGDPLVANFDREDPVVAGTFGTIVLKAASTLPVGSDVAGSLLGGLGTIGGVAFDVDVATGGTLTGNYQVVALQDLGQAIPDSAGLVIAAGSGQGSYAIWGLEFSGSLLSAGTSQVTFEYDPALVVGGQLLSIYAWDGAQWVRVEGALIFTASHLITIDIDAFTIFALVIHEISVPVLSLFGMLSLTGGLVVSGIMARSRRRIGSAR